MHIPPQNCPTMLFWEETSPISFLLYLLCFLQEFGVIGYLRISYHNDQYDLNDGCHRSFGCPIAPKILCVHYTWMNQLQNWAICHVGKWSLLEKKLKHSSVPHLISSIFIYNSKTHVITDWSQKMVFSCCLSQTKRRNNQLREVIKLWYWQLWWLLQGIAKGLGTLQVLPVNSQCSCISGQPVQNSLDLPGFILSVVAIHLFTVVIVASNEVEGQAYL